MEEDLTCDFCCEAIENAGGEITVMLDGENIVVIRICNLCKKAIMRDKYFRGDAVGALFCEMDSNLWNEFCTKCQCVEGCKMQFAVNCPSIRKAIADEA
jgi:ribosomal protein L24E